MGERELAQERSNVVKHFSDLHEMYTIVPAGKKCKSNYIECLIYPDDILERGNSEQSLVCFVLLWEFHPKMTNWTFLNSPSFTQLFPALN
jgi:hypothetical protein